MKLNIVEKLLLFFAVLGGVVLIVAISKISKHSHHTQHNVHYDEFIRQKVNNLTSSIQVCDKKTTIYKPPWDPVLQDTQHAEGFLWQQFFSNTELPHALPKRDGVYQASDLLIFIPTGHVTRVRAAAVKETWGKHVGKLVFVSDLQDPFLPTALVSNSSQEGSFALSKVVEGFKYVHDVYGEQYKWFGKMDDDTFLVVDNLLKKLDEYDYTKDYFLGMCNIGERFGVCSGGAGYILSQGALKKLYAQLINGACYKILKEEDVAIGTCLHDAGVNSTTLAGFKSNGLLMQLLSTRDVADEPISFHYVYPKLMLELDWMLHFKEND